MITMHARPRQTDRRTDEHHGNSATIATIRSMNVSCTKKLVSNTIRTEHSISEPLEAKEQGQGRQHCRYL